MTKTACFVPDLHIPIHDEPKLQALISFIEDFQPDEVIFIGDVMDFPQPSRWSKDTRDEFEGSVFMDCEYAKDILIKPLRRVFGGKVGVIEGNHDCAWKHSRIVTKDGLKNYQEINTGDLVMSVDDDGSTCWVPVQAVKVYDFDGLLNRTGGRDAPGVFTDNHRAVGLDRRSDTWVEHPSGALPNRMRVFSAGYGGVTDHDISDNQIRLAAWMLTDSSYSQRRWTFYQSGDKSEVIRTLLTDLGLGYREYRRNRDISTIDGKVLKSTPKTQFEFHLDTVVSDRISGLLENRDSLPDWVWSLSQRQARLFLEELVFTDGTIVRGGPSKVIYCSNRTKMRHQIMALATANGLRASETEYRPGHWRVNLCERRFTGLYAGSSEKVRYTDKVWCLQVPNGRFFIEESGRIHLTGNSRPREYQERYAPALSGSDVFDLDVLLDFDDYDINLLPWLYRFAPGWAATHGHLGGISLSKVAGATALNAAQSFGLNVVCGHSHRLGMISETFGWVENDRTLTGVEVGHLTEMSQMKYLNNGAGNWQQGFAVGYWEDDKYAFVTPVPVSTHFVVEGQLYEV